MWLTCICGGRMTNGASPNDIQHLLISDRSIEQLQNLVDGEVRTNGHIGEWPEHWENSGATEVWMCPACSRLYVWPTGPRAKIIVYSIERIGI
jgi:hypothetical protein